MNLSVSRLPLPAFHFRWLPLLGILLLAGLASARGQIIPEAYPGDTTLAEAPRAIPVINLVRKIGAAREDIKKLSDLIVPLQGVAQIDSLLPVYSKLVQERRGLAELLVERPPNRYDLENLIYTLRGYQDYFETFLSNISFNAGRNSILLNSLEAQEKTWELTYQNAVEEGVPVDLLQNVKTVLDGYAAVKSEVLKENGKYLNLQAEVNDQLQVIEAEIDDLNALKSSRAYQIFHLRDRPLWKTSFSEDSGSPMRDLGVDSVSTGFRSIWDWIASKENALYLFFILLGLIVYGVRFIRKGFEKYDLGTADEGLRNARQLMLDQKPWVEVFLVTLSARFFFLNTPILFDDLVLLFLLISAALLVRPLAHSRFRNVPFFIILLFIFEFAKTYLPLNAWQYRLYFLFQTMVFAGTLFHFTHPLREIRKIKFDRFGTLFQRTIPVLYVLAGIAFVSNLLGYTNLAEVMVKILSQGSALTLILYAIMIVAHMLARGLLHRYFSSNISRGYVNRKVLEHKITRTIRIGVVIFWVYYFLQVVDLYLPISEAFSSFFNIPYEIGNVTFTLGMIFEFMLILAISFLITGFISFLLDGREVKLNFLKLPRGIPAAISLVIRYFILAFGFVLALSALGIDLGRFNLLAGALGLGIGFGLQTVVSNFISGVILIFERPILTGDVVEVNNLLGTVTKIGVRSSRISTYDGAEVVVPNNNLVSKDLINWTLSDNIRRNEIRISTAYGTNLNKVLEILKEVVSENELVLTKPAPEILFDKFGDSALEFRVLFWVYFHNTFRSKSDISVAIYNRFETEGIKIPFPQVDVHFDKRDDANP